jgi:hypothetical protein
LDNYGNVKWSFDENGKRYYEGATLGSGTVQDALKGQTPHGDEGTGKVNPGVVEYTVPADPTKPTGEQLRVREVRDDTGAIHLEVRDADGQVVLTTQPGEQVSRDATTGKLTVTDGDGNESDSYTDQGVTTTTDPATQQIIDAFSQPTTYTDAHDIKLADAGTAMGNNTLSDADPQSSNIPNTNWPPGPADTAKPATNTVAPTNAIFQTPETDAALQPLGDGIGVINALTAVAHWDAQTDLGHLNTLVNLYTSFDHLGGGNNLPGDLGQFGGYLGLGMSLQNGDGLGVLSSINSIGTVNGVGTIDGVIDSALGSSGVPYMSTLMALNNVGAHPGQSLGAIIGGLWGPLGSTLGGFVGGILDSLFGGSSPPPPEGIVHYTLDEHGSVQVQVQSDTSGGAAPAGQVASQLLGVLQSVVEQQNTADPGAHPGENLCIDPSRLPRVGFDHDRTWIELTRPDGSIVREAVDPSTVGQRMLQVALDNDALVPQWQIQTTVAHAQPPVQQGHASEATDHKTQTYDALVVHLSPDRSAQVQASIEAITEQAKKDHATTNGQSVYRDADGDGFYEVSQWVDAVDDAGNAQGLLVIDRNHDNVISSADILHLGNPGQSNSMDWLDANGDGKLDASDPAFAAIKIWTDLNHDGKVDKGGVKLDIVRIKTARSHRRTCVGSYANCSKKKFSRHAFRKSLHQNQAILIAWSSHLKQHSESCLSFKREQTR